MSVSCRSFTHLRTSETVSLSLLSIPNVPVLCSLPGQCGHPDSLPKPDVTPSAEVPAEPRPKHRSVTERRREGRYRTFDWAEFRPQIRAARPDADPQKAKAPTSLELCDLERRKRREERRRRYESTLGISLGACVDPPAGGGPRALSPKRQQRVEEEVEECWRLVEATVLRLDRSVPLLAEPAGLEELLEACRKEVSSSLVILPASTHSHSNQKETKQQEYS